MAPFCWERTSSREAVERRNVLSRTGLKTNLLFHRKFWVPGEKNWGIFSVSEETWILKKNIYFPTVGWKKRGREEVMKNKQTHCTRSKIQSKIGLEVQGLVLTAQPAFPGFWFSFCRAGSWALDKTGEPKASGSLVVPGYRAICMAGLSWSCLPWESRLPGSPPGELAGNPLGALPVLCWKFIESDISPRSISVLMNWHFPVKTCFVAKFLTSCSPGCHAAPILAPCICRYFVMGVVGMVLSPCLKFVCFRQGDSRGSQGWCSLSVPLVQEHFLLLLFLCWSFAWSRFAEAFCTTLALNP